MNGILIADKPAGWTSHDVVARVKKALGARKVGHLGTLDPMATGVLPLVINQATKFARFLDGGKKEYLCAMKLGAETDTYDAEGRVTASADPSFLTGDAIIKALKGFAGKIRQVPPMYSSKKINGTPLYRMARKGIVIEREAREVEIFSLEVTEISVPNVRFMVSCSKGTYVRALCNDAGRVLGCGAYLAGLRRTGCGPFSIDEAIDPTSPGEELAKSIIPLEDALKRASSGSQVLAAASF
jgi:tRNA pseudouridine55 synthase